MKANFSFQAEPLTYLLNLNHISRNFSIHFWKPYVSLFAPIAAIVSLLLTSDRKSSRWKLGFDTEILKMWFPKL